MSRNKEDKKRGAVISAVIIIVVLAVFVGFILFPLISEMGGVFFAVMLLMLYIGGILAVIFGILAALKQRLEEIEGGEEEEAKKY
jgi:MFS family permease